MAFSFYHNSPSIIKPYLFFYLNTKYVRQE